MKMSEEMAVRLHRMMWSDMQRELGDNPEGEDRIEYKMKWVKKHFPGEIIDNNCWLCEFTHTPYSGAPQCKNCPIKWPHDLCTDKFMHYQSAPISKILALPARNKDLVAEYVANDEKVVVDSYYKYREDLLSKASGIPATLAIEDHVKAIQEKAVEEYFAKTPGAKLATMDVDDAFRQHADEQKAPIFRALAEASGLSAGNESVSAHISLIRDTAKQNGRMEKCKEIFDELSESSGLSKGNWCLNDHIKAIQKKASNEKTVEILRKTSMQLADKLDRYKYALSKESNLDRNRPVDDHIREIVKNSMEAGAAEERDRIQEKVYEVILS